MTLGEIFEKHIASILGAHGIVSKVAEETEDILIIPINKLGEHSSTKNIPIDEAISYHRNLAEACSALSTFCNREKLSVMYNHEDSKFIIKQS